MFNLSKETCNTLRFIIVSENEDKIEEAVLNILYIFWIRKKRRYENCKRFTTTKK